MAPQMDYTRAWVASTPGAVEKETGSPTRGTAGGEVSLILREGENLNGCPLEGVATTSTRNVGTGCKWGAPSGGRRRLEVRGTYLATRVSLLHPPKPV